MPSIGNLRAYLASTGATGALIAGAIVAFLSAGALVAFDGSPLGGDGAEGSASLADRPGGFAPEAAAAALRAGSRGVAARPAGGEAEALIRPGSSAGGGGAGFGAGGGDGDGPTTTTDGGGPVSGTVGTVDDTTGGSGLPALSDPLGPVTGPVDGAIGGLGGGDRDGLLGN